MKYSAQLQIRNGLSFFTKEGPVLGRHGRGNEYPIERVVRRYLPRKQAQSVAEVLPECLRSKIIGVNYSEIRVLAPHVHNHEQCVINFYQETSAEVTSFWEGEAIPDDRWSLDNGNGYYHVNHELLTVTESFVAKVGDVRILDSRQPHSVTYLNDDRTDGYQFLPKNDDARIVIQAYFDTPYSEVLYELQKAGLVID